VKFTGNEDDDEEIIMDDDHTPIGPASSRPTRKAAAQGMKKMKIDEEQ
jgi:hypothetical protein